VGGSLGRYKDKRNFSRTREPDARDASASSDDIFVIHKHAARNLHYDLRLALGGTLKSWAVPKGPSLNPAVKRLAVQVEDHPIEYASFEGNIPEGEYGAGAVIVWDKGVWQCSNGEAQQQYDEGSMKFELKGQKLQGRWMLIRMKGRASENEKNNWLLKKESDEHAREDFDILSQMPESTVSGHTIEETEATDRPSEESLIKLDAELKRQKTQKRDLPKELKPQLASLTESAPEGANWLHEIKYDGYRLMAYLDNNKVRLLTRNGHDWTYKYQSIAKALMKLGLSKTIIDGELVVAMPDGKTSFHELQNFGRDSSGSLVFFAFDLPFYKGYDLRESPLLKRKEILQLLLPFQKESNKLRYSDHVQGGGGSFYKEICKMSLEGCVSKKSSSSYKSARSKTWLKTKCMNSEEFVLCGFTYESRSKTKIGALLLGSYDTDRQLHYVGKVGTGFKERERQSLLNTLSPLTRKKPPVIEPPTSASKAIWVRPVVLAEVKFAEKTPDGILRHAVFQGLREDKAVEELRQEQASAVNNRTKSSRNNTGKRQPQKEESSKSKLSNPDRVLYPDNKLTKADLAAYYQKVSAYMLRDIKSRPLVLIRCPKGINEQCFFQKHVNTSFPDDMPTIEVEPGTSPYAMVESAADLSAMSQLSVIEIHNMGASKQNLEKPDRLIFDLDPDEGLPPRRVVDAALLLRELLQHLGLTSFVKLTGGKGLHVVVPLNRKDSWDDAKTFSAGVAQALVSGDPDAYTAGMAKKARKNKVFIDHFRNARGASAIANYSPRARPGAPVATPLRWDELKSNMAFNKYTIQNIGRRLGALKKDPWHEFYKTSQSLRKNMFRALGL